MLSSDVRHFLTGEELSRNQLIELLTNAQQLKEGRFTAPRQDLAQRSVALLFEKPSLRTRVSFAVAVSELGGYPLDIVSSSRKKEEPEDTIRVLMGYCQAVMVRTFEHAILDKMVKVSKVPVINGLSDSHHPCQILADLLTIRQNFGKYEGINVAYVGDGNNILNSLLLLAPYLGINLRFACPQGFGPNSLIVKKSKERAKQGSGSIHGYVDPKSAAKGAHVLYTDVWTSMGFEEEENDREKIFNRYQINDKLMALADPSVIIMHCMPMVRGKEITESAVDHPGSRLFQQSENRLHVQKALLIELMKGVSPWQN